MGLNLGNYASQLQLNNRNAGVKQAAASNTLGQLGQNAVAQNPYGGQQQGGGWGQTQKYLGAASSLQSGNVEKKNGLQKVLGLVGLFV